MNKGFAIGALCAATLAGCKVSTGVGIDWYHPAAASSWQIQLQGTINSGYDVTLYDIDLFDTPQSLIDDMHAAGRAVVCYFSAGSYENWRSDAGDFQAADLGNPLSGWPGERWLDVRSDNVRSIMQARLDLAAAKGCDGVDPDNVDGYSNATGLPLTAADQLDYNRFLATEAHNRGLAVGLKNDLGQVATLAADFDFAVNESCHDYDECGLLAPFTAAGKPVLNIEYGSAYLTDPTAHQALCTDAATRGLYTLVLPRALDDSFRLSCD